MQQKAKFGQKKQALSKQD